MPPYFTAKSELKWPRLRNSGAGSFRRKKNENLVNFLPYTDDISNIVAAANVNSNVNGSLGDLAALVKFYLSC